MQSFSKEEWDEYYTFVEKDQKGEFMAWYCEKYYTRAKPKATAFEMLCITSYYNEKWDEQKPVVKMAREQQKRKLGIVGLNGQELA